MKAGCQAKSKSSASRGMPRHLALLAVLCAFILGDQAIFARGAPFDFEYAGCARVRPGPVCELGAARELTLWVAGARRPEIEGAKPGDANVTESRAVEGGIRVTFRVPEGQSQVRLRLGPQHASLRIAESSEPPPLRELIRWWKEGKWEQVRAQLEARSRQLAPAERDRARALRARLSLRAGDNQHAADELELTAESAERAGLLLEASNDRWAAVYCRAIRLGQYARALELLESTSDELMRVPEVRARRAYYSGVLAHARGDTQGALLQFRTATVLSRRLGLVFDELQARQELAVTLSQLHRDEEALAEQQALVALDANVPSCLAALNWENLSWMLLTQPAAGAEERTQVALARAEELLERCPDPLSRRNQALNRVAFALLRRDAEEAEARLRALDTDEAGRSVRLATWQALYWGELHLLRAESSKARAAYDLAERLAESLALADCAYLAKLGRARAVAHHADQEAVDAYLAAEQAADELVRWAPFGQGQQLTALALQSSGRELLTLLLELGRTQEALQAAQRAAHRVWASNFRASRIANLNPALKKRWDGAVSEYRERRQQFERVAQEDWKLSFEGLGALRLTRALERQRLDSALASAYALLADDATSGPVLASSNGDTELLIAAGSDSWWAFFSRPGALQVALVSRFASSKVAQVPARELAVVALGLTQVLERFARTGLRSAPLLRVTLPPELQRLDVHALRVDGRPLVEWVPVGYAFEPGGPRDTRPRDTAALSAWVLGDPMTDLARASAEARRVAGRLAQARMLLGEQVTYEATVRGLAHARLLHFAGHARSGGLDGLDGALGLSHGQRLSAGDVLASERVPEFVVLSACTSSVSVQPGGGLSIGQAFLMAGAQTVVGPSRAISDDLAGRFADALYDHLLASSSELPRDNQAWAAAVREAGLQLARADPAADWASIRLLLR
jgi:CHAT domain-containing protein